ncbi:alpha/beta hydrolase-fold protein [uncultured Algibacter sp.]|uniref:alpha/beta hydrolase n=1 Tax=uncultured Algibacter sp. TaxID=298659 RepID=UPI002613954E|nr:alpha/beta hydrolase-fold protein [uncultured Algibacter sp.]
MKNQFHVVFVFAIILFIFPHSLLGQTISKEPKDLFVVGDESVTFTSKINDRGYKLYVKLPDGYANDSTKTYPVYYALDAYGNFGSTTFVYNGIRWDGLAPEVIIVGVAYGGEKPDDWVLRVTDLTPTTTVDMPLSGGASQFLNVLSDEIIPMIDSLYRTDKVNRTLAGTSFGGLFTHYVLFTKPTLFNGYIINNPSFWWDNGYSYRLEEKFSESNTSINARVMLVSGQYDQVQNATKMVNQIKKRRYKNLELGFRIVENMAHAGGESEALSQGMRFVYQRPFIMLPKDELLEYTGKYKTDYNTFEIIVRDGELTWINNIFSEDLKLHALNKSEFSLIGQYYDFHFKRDDKGKVSGLFCHLYPGFSITATKIK